MVPKEEASAENPNCLVYNNAMVMQVCRDVEDMQRLLGSENMTVGNSIMIEAHCYVVIMLLSL